MELPIFRILVPENIIEKKVFLLLKHPLIIKMVILFLLAVLTASIIADIVTVIYGRQY